MYGDCQVMSSMGGNVVVNSDTLFSSSIQNSNFNFIPTMPFQPFPSMQKEEDMLLRGKEEMESGSGSEQVEDKSGNEQESEQPTKKKRYHRHTARQIQEMEALFKECPHPDDKQRLKLSHELGLKPRQVKFWFQNRRTQMKAQQDRADNIILRAENETLKSENYRLQAALRNVMCPNCGGQCIMGADLGLDEHQLRMENARLREELERVCCLTSRYTGRSLQTMAAGPTLMAPSLDLDMNIYPRHYSDPVAPCTEMIPVPMLPPEASPFAEGGGILMEEEKSLALELAASSMAELVKMCQTNEPLWIRSSDGEREVLNFEEHARIFPCPQNLKHRSELRTEASRDTSVVIMNSVTLVDAFLDGQKWMELFPSIVSRAKTVQIISSGASGHASGTLQLMYAEFQVLSPLVSTRETHFLRYCQQNAEEGTWAIVDFPVDNFHQNFHPSYPKYCRRSSGCVIQDMPNGYSRVTWVEHAKVEEKPVHQIFSNYVYSGMAFGAQRWLGVLQRQCERVASLMARNISDLGVIPSPEARKNLMKLAQRMIKTFGLNMSTSGGQSWTAISDSPEDTVRITTRKVTEPGQPNGVILSAVSTTWLPYSHTKVFDLLRDERHRSQMDALSNGNSLNEVAHIANGSHPGNCISLLRINVASNSSQNVELMLQESCTDQSGSLVVYTTIDVDSIQLAMSGEDPSCIALLPQGFMIVPRLSSPNVDTPINANSSESPSLNSGCLLTMGLQVLASTIPSAKLNLSSVTAINNHLCNTLHQIEGALSSSSENGTNFLCTEATVSAPPKQ
ncbi:homeobox-leucine zipper protein HDG5-like isoform X1 [Vigna umbellata]|uniref:homeobox-leucine zipper protein HDG5-like isoform X1 n=1 Tax=Vigna umbellata TaxID=87088 RepID=UPI001F5F2251|nr:homeobox-leucine zipper protein HDG5-like isoform X1 [Vigna umbellata]XP_047179815.1 homeobox-leucine zipper protein HDG5-like isoform X1 [Vigna umbellata]